MPGRSTRQNLRNLEAISLRLEPLAVVNAELLFGTHKNWAEHSFVNGRFAPEAAVLAMSVFGTIETCLPARQMSAYDFIVESNPVRVIDVTVDALDLAEIRLRGGAGGDWSAIVPPLVCLPSGIPLLRDFYVAKVTTSSSSLPAFHEHTLIADGKSFRMAGNCGAPADSTLAHDVAGDDGVTVSG